MQIHFLLVRYVFYIFLRKVFYNQTFIIFTGL